MVSTPNYFQCSINNFIRLWTYLLVVQPIPADGPPIVTKVVLYGWICHLVKTGFKNVKSAFSIDYYGDYRLQVVREMRQITPLTVKIYFLDVNSQGCTLKTDQLTVLPFRHFTRRESLRTSERDAWLSADLNILAELMPHEIKVSNVWETLTLSSSKLRVKCRISANCLARACSLSRCCMGA